MGITQYAQDFTDTGNGDLALKAQQGDEGIKLKLGRYGFKALNAKQFAQTQHRHTNHLIQKGSGYLVSLGFICDLINGKSNPSLRIMEQIADALDTSDIPHTIMRFQE